MRDHRDTEDRSPWELRKLLDITDLVESHRTKHPGSLKRSSKAKARATAKRAKASKQRNR